MRWLWNIWKHLSMSTFPFLPICCVLWVQRSDGWKAESNSWSFHLAKMKRQLQGKSKENIFQLFSLPFLSPFWAWLSLYLMKRSLVSLFFPSPNINLFTPRLAYQSPILPVHGTCSSLVLEAVASPPSFLRDTKEDHAFLLSTSEESALQLSLCRSWC